MLSSLWDHVLQSVPTLGGVVVEITENESVSDYRAIHDKVSAVRNRGGYVAVDDAGSGYSSLKHVMELKPDFVKLDRIFVCECDSERAKAALIEMVGKAAGRLNAWVIAEGVETPAELDELIRLNVPLAQGYYLARPAPEMKPLDDEKSTSLLSRVRSLTAADTVSWSTEFCTVCASREDAERLLSECPRLDLAVITDHWGRPWQLVERHPLTGIRSLSEFMKVQIEDDARETLQRALTRPTAVRFDPVAVTNAQGEFQGILRIDWLAQQILSSR